MREVLQNAHACERKSGLQRKFWNNQQVDRPYGRQLRRNIGGDPSDKVAERWSQGQR